MRGHVRRRLQAAAAATLVAATTATRVATPQLARVPAGAYALANSAGISLGPAYHCDLVRPGIGLFGGGRAALELIATDDVLESGIEIVAQPPGTKLKGITLLSGGQKTLTAVALLFALYMVKPSPFCLLDELDAPLDESNIHRFTNLLKQFVKESQFIIITHNKSTIAAADAIYGVTMQERGVSKTLSMKFDQHKGEPEVLPTTIADSVRAARPSAPVEG